MTDSARILVLGGGLAGLSFAIALATEVGGGRDHGVGGASFPLRHA